MPDPRRGVVGTTLTGGLGNQMFQYAAGLAIAERLGADLLCDISFYQRADRGDRRVGLGEFGINLKLGRVPPFKRPRQLATALGLFPSPFRGVTPFLNQEGFDPRSLELGSPAALSGYFQSWRYFEGHEASIRRTFDTSKLATSRTADLAAEIAAARNPVAVHVRRGDYSATPEAIAAFGMLGADYYLGGRAALEARIEDPTYFLFTDDLGAAQAELADWQGLRPVAGFSGHEDFYLMSLCKHFIIANSTFSWWAAWLGKAPGKQVVGPSAWFGPGYQHAVDIDDRLPIGWIRM